MYNTAVTTSERVNLKGGGSFMLSTIGTAILVGVAANVISYCIVKWLERLGNRR